MEEVFRNPLLMFHKSDFPGRRDTEPWMVHIAEADWTQGHYQILHRHEDFSEIFILLEGNGKYTIGGRLYELQQGDVVLCNQGVMHDEFPAKCDSYRTVPGKMRQLQDTGSWDRRALYPGAEARAAD